MSILTESYSVNDRESWILGNGYVQFGKGYRAAMPYGYSPMPPQGVKELMEKTHTKTGLKAFVHIIDKLYLTGVR